MDSTFEPHTGPDSHLVLVVDDDDEVRDALREVLTTHGYDVACCANGVEALAFLREGHRVSTIVLDLDMPVMDGWSFYRAYRRRARANAVPIILLSAHGGPRRLAPYIGVAELLTKPIDLDALVAAVTRTRVRTSDPLCA